MDENALKLLLDQGASVEEIGRRFRRDASTVAYWMRKYGLEAPNRERFAARGGIERDVLEEMIERGLSIAEIALAVERSKGTVRHWLRRYGLTTQRATRAVSAAVARAEGLSTIERECRVHGRTHFVIEGRSYYRCKRCRQERVAERRRQIKRILVEEAGGACALCGYARFLGALHFHHLDRAEKRLEINCAGATLSLDAMRSEASKCVVLCGNCHAEVEGGIVSLPVE